MNVKKIIALGTSILMLSGLVGCASEEVFDYNEDNDDTRLMINTEHNGIANAEQDIKVITFDGQVLDGYEIIKDGNGVITQVRLNLTKGYSKEKN